MKKIKTTKAEQARLERKLAKLKEGRILTARMLRKADACDFAVEQFVEQFGPRVLVTYPLPRDARKFARFASWLVGGMLVDNIQHEGDPGSCPGCKLQKAIGGNVALLNWWAKKFIAEGLPASLRAKK
jgi:hypothetical protein